MNEQQHIYAVGRDQRTRPTPPPPTAHYDPVYDDYVVVMGPLVVDHLRTSDEADELVRAIVESRQPADGRRGIGQ